MKHQLSIALATFPSVGAFAIQPQDDKTAPERVVKEQSVVVEEGGIPDSLLRARWKIQKTTPRDQGDLSRSPRDLSRPDKSKQEVVYDDSMNVYLVGSKIGDWYLNTPMMMTSE